MRAGLAWLCAAGLIACGDADGETTVETRTPAAAKAPARPMDAGAPPYRVCLLPMGPHDEQLLAIAARGIAALYGFPVEVLPAVELPEAAWYAKRKRWRAEKILEWLDQHDHGSCAAVMAFTEEDISTTKDDHEDWGILGLGNIGGRSGVVSTYRMRRAIAAKGKKRERIIAERSVKVVNHELGHVLGAPHDATPGCIMNDAAGSVKTVDTEDGLLCEGSRRTIAETRGFEVPAVGQLDWDTIVGGASER
jgi:archaemetzincin